MVKSIQQKNNIRHGILKNGMKYIFNDNDIFSSCCIMFYIRVGAVHEKKSLKGIAHLLEHMLFKGTQKYKTFMELNKKFDLLNCTVNAATSKNYTFIDMKIPRANLEEGLKLLEEMVFKSLIVEKELEKEKKVILEEFSKTNDDAVSKLEILTTEFNFENHKLSNLILGERKNVINFSRKDLLNFYKKYYVPSNCCISIVGNLPKNVIKKMKGIFVSKNSHVIQHCIEKYQADKINHYLHSKFVGKLNHISISFPIFSILDKRKYYLDILVDILGGNMTSRLWIALREENQLVYNFNAFYECYEEGGFLSINFSCANKNVKKAIDSVINILQNLTKSKISKEELVLTRKKAIMDIEMNSEENCGIAEFYGEQMLLEQELKNYDDIKKIYKSCTSEILLDLCKSFFVFSKIKIVLSGCLEKKEFDKITKKIKL